MDDARPDAHAPSRRRRGGLVLRYVTHPQGYETDGAVVLGFLPAEVAKRLTALLSVTPVPGAAREVAGLALADGAVVTVLSIGRPPEGVRIEPGADRAVLCALPSFDIALTGGVVVAAGMFDVAPPPAAVAWGAELVPEIDVAALYARASTSPT